MIGLESIATGIWGQRVAVPADAYLTDRAVTCISLQTTNGVPRPFTVTTFAPLVRNDPNAKRGGAFLVEYGTGNAGLSFIMDGKAGQSFTVAASFLRVSAFQGDYELVAPGVIELGAYAAPGAWGHVSQPTLTKLDLDPIPTGGDKYFSLPPLATAVKCYRTPMEPVRLGFYDARYPIGWRETMVMEVPAGAECPTLIIPGSHVESFRIENLSGVAALDITEAVFTLGV